MAIAIFLLGISSLVLALALWRDEREIPGMQSVPDVRERALTHTGLTPATLLRD